MRPVFTDERLERSFTEAGYVVVDMLDEDGVAELVDLHTATAGGEQSGFRASVYTRAPDTRAAIREALARAFDRGLGDVVRDHTLVVGGFVVKAATGESTIAGHLDWSLVDETRHRSVNVWIALGDTTPSNGALAVVPHSHRLPLTIRGSRTPAPLAAPPDVVAEHLKTVPVRAGQAILYEPRTIHGSASNTSGRPRIAAAASLVPSDLVPLHFVGGVDGLEPGELRAVEVDTEFFDSYMVDPASGSDPKVGELIAGRPSWTVASTAPITTEDLRALGGSGRGGLLRRLARRRSTPS